MRTRAERRHNDWKKAIRKSNIAKKVIGLKNGWYKHLHQYSKNKIHCSCGMCCAKTNNKKGRYGPKYNPCMHDMKMNEKMKYDIEKYERELGY